MTACLLVCAYDVSAQTASPCAASDVTREIDRALDERRDGRALSARDRLAELHQRCPSPRVSAQLALAEQSLSRWTEARAHMLEALAHPDDPWIASRRRTLELGLREIEGRLPSPETVRESPPREARPGAAPARTAAVEPRSPGVARALGWTAIGAGAVLVGLGVWQAVAWRSLSDQSAEATPASTGALGSWARYWGEVNADRAMSVDAVCARAATGAPGDAAGVRDLCDESAMHSALALGFGLGGAALATTGIIALVAAPDARSRSSVRVGPLLGAGLRGVSMRAEF